MDAASDPSLRHLRVFEMVSRLQGVRKAADAVHMSQPAVTQAITKLESQVGATLFERRSKGTYLSPEGEIFVARIRLMFAQIEEALGAFGVASTKVRSLAMVAERITRPQIRGLSAIADGRSFADAARKIGISQASLHRAARELERNLGKPLFHNTASGVITTRGGAELARRLSLAMREIEWGVEEIQAAAGVRGGQLRIGALPLAGSFLLAPVINEITRMFPDVQVQVRTGDGALLARSLQLGDIDFVVGMVRASVDPAEIEQEELVSSPYVVVARRGHPLTRKSRLSLSDLERYEWIAPMAGAARRAAFDELFNTMKRKPSANVETYTLSTIRLLLEDSDRLALLSRFEFEYEKGAGVLTALPILPIQKEHAVGVSRRVKWTPTALHLTFLDLVRRHAAKIAAQNAPKRKAA